MKLEKTDLRNRIDDAFLSACVICVVEKEALANVNNEDVTTRFQKMTQTTIVVRFYVLHVFLKFIFY